MMRERGKKKMNARTLKALRGSIAKWRAIVDETGSDSGPLNCPLCQRFIDSSCTGCPVSDATGHPGCGGTPYDERWIELFLSDCLPFRADTLERKAAAQAELDFLISLLPAGEAP
jgi:hypothetical protein